jgi:hypothetical protein
MRHVLHQKHQKCLEQHPLLQLRTPILVHVAQKRVQVPPLLLLLLLLCHPAGQ